MEEMKVIEQISAIQRDNDIIDYQNMINDGSIWKMEGAMGRYAMSLLESGECYLPAEPTFDYYGGRIPSRNELKDGTKGTLGNSIKFYEL